jgi:transposase
MKGDVMTEARALGPDGKDYPTGDLEPRVLCQKCRRIKPISDFHFTRENVSRHQRAIYCKRCKADLDAKRRGPSITQQRLAERRAKVLALAGENYTGRDIAKMLGVNPSTVQADIRYLVAEGQLAPREHKDKTEAAAVKPNVSIVDNLIRQLDDLAFLVHDGRRVILPLEGLHIDAAMAAEWDKRLHHVGQALRYLRSHAKKGNTE